MKHLNLNLVRVNFQKSEMKKIILPKLKNITGNVVSDKEILNLVNSDRWSLTKNTKFVFGEENSRVKIQGRSK